MLGSVSWENHNAIKLKSTDKNKNSLEFEYQYL